ncbi:MAG TPA: hypothetical protein VK694_01655 [Verrucomicrobiae bacterium]|nr:hypothetical protein [Verrucomicrobiae bacterium]
MGEANTIDVADLVAWHNERVAAVYAKNDQIAAARRAAGDSLDEDLQVIEYATARLKGRSHELADFAGWLISHTADAVGELDTLPDNFDQPT